jgi:hypothetical protein
MLPINLKNWFVCFSYKNKQKSLFDHELKRKIFIFFHIKFGQQFLLKKEGDAANGRKDWQSGNRAKRKLGFREKKFYQLEFIGRYSQTWLLL